MFVFRNSTFITTGACWASVALALLLTPFAYADVFIVTTLTDQDNGVGVGGVSLRDAITAAQAGDEITFDGDLLLSPPVTLPLPLGGLLVDKDITITGPGANTLSISGENEQRIFTVFDATLDISDLTLSGGFAKGGSGGNGGGGGGGGAGLGGALLILNGTVNAEDVVFDGNTAGGGDGSSATGDFGGGGGGGTIDEDGGNLVGDVGGEGGDSVLGAGGSGGSGLSVNGDAGTNGGGGGGGGQRARGGNGGDYGGGGGGGSRSANTADAGRGGNGGFGGGGGGAGGATGAGAGTPGTGGQFGGNGGNAPDGFGSGGGGGGGAGLGGAVFVGIGAFLNATNCAFQNNQAFGGSGGEPPFDDLDGADGQGKGGAIFLRSGGQAEVKGSTFSNNSAEDALNLASDNNAYAGALVVLDVSMVIDDLSDDPDALLGDAVVATAGGKVTLRAIAQEFDFLNWSGSATFDPALFGGKGNQVLELNPALGPLTLDSIKFDLLGPGADTLAISGQASTRIFKLVNSNVKITDLTLQDGFAQGGSGGTGNAGGGGGAGMGGAIFAFQTILRAEGVVFENNEARGGSGGISNGDSILGGGGGGSSEEEGLSATDANGGSGGRGVNEFTPGGASNGGNGSQVFGGGGGGGQGLTGGNGGAGGFGGGGGGGGSSGGNGGAGGLGGGGGGGVGSGDGGLFGGEGGASGGGGAGLGGALFINQTSSLVSTNCAYLNNSAIGGAEVAGQSQPGQSKGGAIFIEGTVPVTLEEARFSNNTASDATGVPGDNPSIFGLANVFGIEETIDDASDLPDANPGDGSARTASATTTFRSVLDEFSATGWVGSATFDEVLFAGALPVVVPVASSMALLNGELSIEGPGADQLVFDGGGTSRVLEVLNPALLNLSGVTLTNGFATEGGGIFCTGGLDLIDSAVTSCTTSSGNGGGIFIQGSVNATRILNCLLADNVAEGTGGGIAIETGTVSLTNSTISGNQSVGDGGGVGVPPFLAPIVTITNCTVTNNRADIDDALGGLTGGVLSSGACIFRNTIVAGNFGVAEGSIRIDPSPDVGGVVTGNANNFIGVGTSLQGVLGSDITFDEVDVSGIDEVIAPLLDNGGPTRTHAVVPFSPALNNGNNGFSNDPFTFAPLATDQRGEGFSRRQSSQVDIGAFELPVESIGPEVFLEQSPTQADPTNTFPIEFNVVFSEPVIPINVSSVALNGSAQGINFEVVEVDSSFYKIRVLSATGDGTIQPIMFASATTDTFGNNSLTPVSQDATVTLDTTAPTVELSTESPNFDVTSPITIEATFNEPVTGLGLGEIEVENGVASNLQGSGTEFSFQVSALGLDQFVVRIPHGVAQDAVGNPNSASADFIRFFAGIGEGEGEGILEGEGVLEGEGIADGEGIVEGEGDIEGEGEGDPLDPTAEGLLESFDVLDTNVDSALSLSEARVLFPALTFGDFLSFDSNIDGQVTVAEFLNAIGANRIIHSADTNGDRVVSLSELVRLVQLYNAEGYTCLDLPGESEDGYESLGAKGNFVCALPHAADVEGAPDGVINLSELLRVIQFFSTGGMEFCEGLSEDDYCPAP